jgi:hypothetical protein
MIHGASKKSGQNTVEKPLKSAYSHPQAHEETKKSGIRKTSDTTVVGGKPLNTDLAPL